jgi:hypothetical protein
MFLMTDAKRDVAERLAPRGPCILSLPLHAAVIGIGQILYIERCVYCLLFLIYSSGKTPPAELSFFAAGLPPL